MELLNNLLTQCFISQGSVLHVGGRSITSLAARYGTPLFVYDRSVLDQKIDLLRRSLPQFDIYYSVKANPNLAILRHFVLRGCGLEVASAGEFLQALAAGCRPDAILMAGPGKSDTDLQLVLAGKIGEIHIESIHEAARIAAISRENRIRARVGIRVNPTSEAEGGAMRMGGKPAPFGIDEEEMDSQEAKTFVRQHFEEFVNRQDLSAADRNFAPDYREHGGFWNWLVVCYLFTLALEMALLLAGRPAAKA